MNTELLFFYGCVQIIIDDDQAMVDLLAEYVLEIGCQVKTYTDEWF